MSAAPPRSTIPQLAKLDLAMETQRLRLRPFTERDVDDIWPVVSDGAFSRQMSWAAHADRDETVAFIRGTTKAIADNVGVAWAIEHEGRAQGCVSLDTIRWHLRAWRVDRAELGYWLAPSLWKQGFMTEAVLAIVRFGFETIGLNKIGVGCLADNPSSRRVIEKVGFRHVGRLEDDVWRDGGWMAVLRYELTAFEWSDVHTTLRVSRPRPT